MEAMNVFSEKAMAIGGSDPDRGTGRQLKTYGWEAALQVVTVTVKSLGGWNEHFIYREQ